MASLSPGPLAPPPAAAHDRACEVADLPVRRELLRRLALPLQHDADGPAHRQRHVRRSHHRPPDLPAVAHEFVVVQSELYLGPQNGTADEAKIAAEKPDAILFNGYVNQYDHAPIRVRVGQRVRVWVVDAGPQRATAFHVVGAQFDTVFKEGAYLLKAGNAEHGASQVLDLAPAQGGFVELDRKSTR